MKVLDSIVKQGGKVYLATAKPEIYAFKIIKHFGLLKYFTYMAGNDMEETRCAKQDVIKYLFDKASIDAEGTLMIGDRSYDITGAHICGIPAAAVLHGYGSREELKDADFILEKFTDLLSI